MPSVERVRRFLGRYLYTAPRVGFALTVGLVSRANRTLLWDLARRTGYLERAPALPVVDADTIVDVRIPVILREVDAANGNVSLRELVFLAQLVKTRGPEHIFEIGTFDGRTTLALAANAPDDAVVRTLDLPPGTSTAMAIVASERVFVEKAGSGARVHSTDMSHKVQQLYGDSATFDFSPYPSALVFVDGSHAYEYVLSDSRKALAMLSSGAGDIVWHDYTMWEGVTRALDELQREDPRFAGLRHIAGTTLAVLTR